MKTFTSRKRMPKTVARRTGFVVPPKVTMKTPEQNATIRRILRGPQVQAKLTIGSPNDQHEREADRVADEVMRMPEPGAKSRITASPSLPLLQRFCPDCAAKQARGEALNCPECEEQLQRRSLVEARTETIQRSRSQKNSSDVPPTVEAGIASSRGSGLPLPKSIRTFMEPRFGHDFGHVRLHDDEHAADSARAVQAQAFTVGSDVYLGRDRPRLSTNQGRHLLAHELTHVIQQETSGRNEVRRRLTVDRNHPSFAPSTDPAAAMTPFQRLSDMDQLIQSLCGNFEVDKGSTASPGTGLVRFKTGGSFLDTLFEVFTKPTGCCCILTLVDAATDWFIKVSQVLGPQTRPPDVVLSPLSSPIDFGSFTSGGSLAFQGAVPAAGHEICGHAALMEIGAHPSTQSRTTTDVHDPTVRIENRISSEQGVAAGDLRGLAGSSSHRGESVDRITIGPFPFNGKQITPALQPEVDFAAQYIIANRSWVDVLGHSDPNGSTAAKTTASQERADNTKAALLAASVPATITKLGLTGVNRFTRVEGLGDTQPPSSPTGNADWRRVELLIAGFPAGAQNPPTGTPTTVTPHTQQASVPALRSSTTDLCVALLVGSAYP